MPLTIFRLSIYLEVHTIMRTNFDETPVANLIGKASTIVIYKSRVINVSNLLVITTVES